MKTRTKIVHIHKNVSQGYYKVKLHIINNFFIFVMLAFIRFDTQKIYLRKSESFNKKVTFSHLQ